MKEPYKLFKNIKKARTSSGLSQKELAKRLGVSDKTVSAYETGRAIPPTPTLAKIAEITKTSVNNLMDVENGENDISKRLEKLEDLIKKHTEKKPKIKNDTFVGVVLLDNKHNVYLIKEGDKNKISLGRWNLPGGSVDGEEGFVDAASRATKEETGYSAKIHSLLGVYRCKKGKASWIYTVFKAQLDNDGKKPVDSGVKDGKWFSKKEFLDMKDSKIVHPVVKLVYNIATTNKGLSVKSVKHIDYDKDV